jgi:hypothetical protein
VAAFFVLMRWLWVSIGVFVCMCLVVVGLLYYWAVVEGHLTG